MKIALGIGILVVIGATLGFVILRGSIAPALPELPAGEGSTAPEPEASSTKPIVPGSSFRGPTGPPHIVGPKSDPPNY